MSADKKKRSQSNRTQQTQASDEEAQVLEAENAELEEEKSESVRIPVEDLERMKTELENYQKQSREYQEGWARERADFINYKKRIEREQAQMQQVLAANILKKFLAVFDDIDLAIKNKPQGVESKEWWNGVELIQRKLTSILEAEGVKPIEAENEFFNPNFHEAISHEESEGLESGQIIEVMQQGFKIGDRVIRPAVVRVAK